MPDGGASTDFTVRLVNQVTAPANAIKRAMGEVAKAVGDTQRQINAPAPKRGALSDWDKMVSKAKLGQAADFARQHQRLVASQKKSTEATKPTGDGSFMSTVAGVVTGEALIGALKEVSAGAFGAVAGVITEVASLGAQFFEAATDAALFAQKSTMAIGFLTDNAPAAAGVFDDIRHQAQGLGLDVEDTVGSFQKLLAAQFSIGQSKDLIKMGADMQAIGASAEEVQRIIYAMTEIKSIGSLQKRQERMLQMAGISGQLIDQALMKRTGIKTPGGVQLARKKNLIGADVAIEAIKDAVMAKTHESELGDAGKTFADATLAGMAQELKGGIKNFFIDVGNQLLPNLTSLAHLIAGTIGDITKDPALAYLGQFLLTKFQVFTWWAEDNWPKIQSVIIFGLHAIAAAIEVTVGNVEMLTPSASALTDALYVVKGAAALAAIAIAGMGLSVLLFFSPVLIAVGLIGLLGYAVYEAAKFILDAVPKWYEAGKSLIRGLIEGMLFMMGPLGAVIAGIMIATSPSPGDKTTGGAAAGLPASTNGSAIAALSSVGSDEKTEGGHSVRGSTVHIASMPITVPQAEDPQKQATLIGEAVRTELEKSLHPG